MAKPMDDRLTPTDHASASLVARASGDDVIRLHGWYTVVCLDADGNEKWRDMAPNLVTTVGKNDILDKYLKGAAYTQTIRMGLKGVGSAAVGDTQASHAGWLEVGLANAPTYTGNRKDVTMNAAVAGVSTSPVQAFAITSSGTLAGCFINNGGSATKDNTTGVLFSAGDFTEGNRVVVNGDTINVTYSLAV
jgi:hypothetical protein